MEDVNAPNPIPAQVTLSVVEPPVRAYLLRNKAMLGALDREMKKEPAIRALLAKSGGIVKMLTANPIDPVALVYIDKFINFQNGLLINQLLGQSQNPVPQWEPVAQEVFRIAKIATDTATHLDACCAEIKAKLDNLERQVDAQTKELKQYIDKKTDEIITNTAEEVANRVVGESYYKVISTTTNAPTIVMVYKEPGKVKYPRRCQLKWKIDIPSEAVTDALIEKYRKAFKEIKTPWITYGNVRACYVSEDKKFRNVLFVKEKEDALAILTFMYRLLDRPFDEKNLSLTTGRNRSAFNRKKSPLDGIEPFEQNYEESFRVQWYRIVLLVAGIPKPILLYKNYDI